MITNLQKSLWRRPKSTSEHVTFSENRFLLLENSFFKSRPHMAPQADPQNGKCSYIDPLSFTLSSKTGLSRPKNDILTQGFDLDPNLS